MWGLFPAGERLPITALSRPRWPEYWRCEGVRGAEGAVSRWLHHGNIRQDVRATSQLEGAIAADRDLADTTAGICRHFEQALMTPEVSPFVVTITSESPANPICVRLVEAHWQEMGELYGDTGPCLFSPADVNGEGCAFLVAWINGAPVGCGAVRPFNGDEGEVKRVYVAPKARNRGVAGLIMIEIERIALSLGYASLRLETGTLQPYAIRLYERLGYLPIPPYGPYVDDPRSRCFAKCILDRTF